MRLVTHPRPVLWPEANPTSDSLDVVQQPQRARMCGFGDKVRLFLGNWLWALDQPATTADTQTGPPTHHSAALCEAHSQGRKDRQGDRLQVSSLPTPTLLAWCFSRSWLTRRTLPRQKVRSSIPCMSSMLICGLRTP